MTGVSLTGTAHIASMVAGCSQGCAKRGPTYFGPSWGGGSNCSPKWSPTQAQCREHGQTQTSVENRGYRYNYQWKRMLSAFRVGPAMFPMLGSRWDQVGLKLLPNGPSLGATSQVGQGHNLARVGPSWPRLTKGYGDMEKLWTSILSAFWRRRTSENEPSKLKLHHHAIGSLNAKLPRSGTFSVGGFATDHVAQAVKSSNPHWPGHILLWLPLRPHYIFALGNGLWNILKLWKCFPLISQKKLWPNAFVLMTWICVFLDTGWQRGLFLAYCKMIFVSAVVFVSSWGKVSCLKHNACKLQEQQGLSLHLQGYPKSRNMLIPKALLEEKYVQSSIAQGYLIQAVEWWYVSSKVQNGSSPPYPKVARPCHQLEKAKNGNTHTGKITEKEGTVPLRRARNKYKEVLIWHMQLKF